MASKHFVFSDVWRPVFLFALSSFLIFLGVSILAINKAEMVSKLIFAAMFLLSVICFNSGAKRLSERLPDPKKPRQLSWGARFSLSMVVYLLLVGVPSGVGMFVLLITPLSKGFWMTVQYVMAGMFLASFVAVMLVVVVSLFEASR